MSVLDLLKQARDRIAKQTHVAVGLWADKSECACAVGALFMERGHDPTRACFNAAHLCSVDSEVNMARELLHRHAQIVIRGTYDDIYSVNDILGRDAVLEVYDAAIAKLEAAS